MSVFFRWGVFGILAVAALLYAYNASKRLSENRRPPTTQVVSDEDAGEDAGTGAEEEAAEEPESEPPLPEVCEEERQVAERALKMRRDGEPLDRLLRIDRIAFQSDAQRRERLEAVARHWFEREGHDPDAAALRGQVLRDCRRALAMPASTPPDAAAPHAAGPSNPAP